MLKKELLTDGLGEVRLCLLSKGFRDGVRTRPLDVAASGLSAESRCFFKLFLPLEKEKKSSAEQRYASTMRLRTV